MIHPDSYNEDINKIYNEEMDYTPRRAKPKDISMTDTIFVWYVAFLLQVDIVVHVVFGSNDDDPNDQTTGQQRWLTRIYRKSGIARCLQKDSSSFEAVNWKNFPHQIILYEIDGPNSIWHYIPTMEFRSSVIPGPINWVFGRTTSHPPPPMTIWLSVMVLFWRRMPMWPTTETSALFLPLIQNALQQWLLHPQCLLHKEYN